VVPAGSRGLGLVFEYEYESESEYESDESATGLHPAQECLWWWWCDAVCEKQVSHTAWSRAWWARSGWNQT